ncbi:Metalloenzyme, LuxS/M16 peptidase-like protein [Hyaloraphidium curvatum]|nr:Metalloenzyme, LuxS/M16 peptidase-like protein [Hyaloraphidium curvatum]
MAAVAQAALPTPPMPDIPHAPTTRLITAPDDKFGLPVRTPSLLSRKTLKMVLGNRMNVVLVSDPLASAAGAALAVETGSWRDSREGQEGLAHFLEHMLFLGTEKFPQENAYDAYVAAHNGQMNAYTSSDHSLYHFEVAPGALEGALERFAWFFRGPLFNESCVDREQNAVDQEFRRNIESDPWRLLHVRKELSNPSHPFSLFNTGNLQTMKLIDRRMLRVWFDRYYSANLMNLCVVGREPLRELVAMVERHFGPVRDVGATPVPIPPETGPVFPPEATHGKWVRVEPLKDLRELGITWELPPRAGFADLDTKPAGLLGHVLGHEGQGSLLSYLKAKLWAEELSAGRSEMGVDNDTFEVSVSLTEEGLKHADEVVGAVFAALERFRRLGPYPEYLFEELNLMARIGWDYQQRGRGTATSYAGMMRREGIETFPGRQLFISRFDPAGVARLADFLRPERAMVTLVAKEHLDADGLKIDLDKTEKWMGAKYAVQPFTPAQLAAWSFPEPLAEVSWPAPNPFIPRDLRLLNDPDPAALAALAEGRPIPPFRHPPELLRDGPEGRTYLARDDEFFVPQSSFGFHILTPRIRPGSAEGTVDAQLYLRFVHERLSELSYPAHYAGLSYDVWVHQNRGLGVNVTGYSERLPALLDSVMAAVVYPRPTRGEFEVFRESLERGYRNAEKEGPVRQAMEVASSVLYRDHVASPRLAEAAAKATFEGLEAFVRGLFDRTYLEAVVGGNVDAEAAEKAVQTVRAKLGKGTVTMDEVKRSELMPLDGTRPLVFQPPPLKVAGNGFVLLVSLGEKTNAARLSSEMLSKLLKEPFYSELRTVQQTGYLVHSGSMLAGNRELFLQMAIQSNSHDPRDLLARCELFLESFLRGLAENAGERERFETLKAGVAEKLRQPYDNMQGKVRYLEQLAFDEDGDFDMVAERLALLENYTFEDLQAFANATLGKGNRKRLAVLTTGNDPENVAGNYLPSDVAEYRKERVLAKL